MFRLTKLLLCTWLCTFLLFPSFAQNTDELTSKVARLIQLREFERALPYAKDAYLISKTVFGENDPKTIFNLYLLSSTQYGSGHLEEALEGYTTVLPHFLNQFGEDSPHTEIIIIRITDILSTRGDWEEAAAYAKRGAKITTSITETKDSVFALKLFKFATVLFKYGEIANADKLLEESFEILANDSAIDDIVIAQITAYRVVTTRLLGNFVKSEELAHSAIDKYEPSSDLKVPILNIKLSLAETYSISNKSAECISLAEEVLKLLTGNEKAELIERIRAYLILGEAYKNIGLNTKAMTCVEKGITELVEIDFADYPQFARLRSLRGRLYMELGNIPEARSDLDFYMNTIAKHEGTNSLLYGEALLEAAYFFQQTGDYLKAQQYYESGFQVLIDKYVIKPPNLGNAYRNYGKLLQVLGDQIRADKYFNDARIVFDKYKDTHEKNFLELLNLLDKNKI